MLESVFEYDGQSEEEAINSINRKDRKFIKIKTEEVIEDDGASMKRIFDKCPRISMVYVDGNGGTLDVLFKAGVFDNIKLEALYLYVDGISRDEFQKVCSLPFLITLSISSKSVNANPSDFYFGTVHRGVKNLIVWFEFYHPTISTILTLWTHVGAIEKLNLSMFMTDKEADVFGKTIMHKDSLKSLRLDLKRQNDPEENEHGDIDQMMDAILDYIALRNTSIDLTISMRYYNSELYEYLVQKDVINEFFTDGYDYSDVDNLADLVINSKTVRKFDVAWPMPYSEPRDQSKPSLLKFMHFDHVEVSLARICKAFPNLEELHIEHFHCNDESALWNLDIFHGLDNKCKLKSLEIDYIHSGNRVFDIKLVEQSYRAAVRRGFWPSETFEIHWLYLGELENGEPDGEEIDYNFDSWNEENPYYMPEGNYGAISVRNRRMKMHAKQSATAFLAASNRVGPRRLIPKGVDNILAKYLSETWPDIQSWNRQMEPLESSMKRIRL